MYANFSKDTKQSTISILQCSTKTNKSLKSSVNWMLYT